VKSGYVKKLYEEGWFFIEERDLEERNWFSKKELSRNLERQSRVEEILSRLPRRECGVCGCPDCRTFAEDVVDGLASLEECSQLTSSDNQHLKPLARRA
jgi:ArsR family metal-binding transcriptional regulator